MAVLSSVPGIDSGAVLCDGVGGGAAGEVASRTAAESVIDSLTMGDGDIGVRLSEAIGEANAAVRRYARNNLGGVACGTTLVIAVVRGGRLTVAHVGDSRAYLLRAGTISRLTHDHSFVADLVRDGKMAESEAAAHPMRGSLTRAIGVADAVSPDVSERDLTSGDVVLLCSDGLHALATDAEIAAAVGIEMARSARALIDLANAHGGTDNVSVALYQVDRTPDTMPAE